MTVKKLTTAEEIHAALEISYTSFHIRNGNIDEEAKNFDFAAADEYAAFDDFGNMTAHAANNHFTVRFDGSAISCGGIGSVSTLPEYRSSGSIRAIFEKLLNEGYANGEALSALFPFKHSFYRKFGYDTLTYTTYTFPPSALAGYRHDGWVKQWHSGETACLFKEVYDAFAQKYNLSFVRDGEMKRHIGGDPLLDRKFAYLIGGDDGPKAYVSFRDIKNEPMAHMKITDCAFIGKEGLYSLFGFLARFEADYGTIAIHLPEEIDLLKLVKDPYAVTGKRECGFMVRAVNARELLRLMKKPEGAVFTIGVKDDELIEANNGTFRVSGGTVEPTSDMPDIICGIRALAPMALGVTPLEQAVYRSDVSVISNTETLKKVFTAKPVHFSERF